MRRFYAPRENFRNEEIVLGSDETRHLRSVLRLGAGERIAVFDGAGAEFVCLIKSIKKNETVLEILREVPVETFESKLDLILAAAPIKGDKFDLVIQKAVELGVSEFVPVLTARCDVKIKNPEKKSERWRKIIVEASKQTGRAALMRIGEPTEFEFFAQNASGAKILFSERGGESFESIEASEEFQKPGKITAAIGSEGGWEEREIDFAGSLGFRIVTLGTRILRAETAVISVAAILQNRFGDLK